MSNERRLVGLNEVEQKPLQWLWEGYLPLGALTDFLGDPAQGKSRVALDLTSRITRGRPMPGHSVGSPPAGVVLLMAEDSVSSTIKPDLVAAGANVNRVIVYDPSKFSGKPLTLPSDLQLVKDGVAAVRAKLVVIDPATAFFSCNANSDQSVRKAISPLVDFAAKEQISIMLIRHPNKGSSGNPLYQAAGSIAWVAAARSALRAINDPTDTDPYRHLLVQIKTNLASAPSQVYRTLMNDDHISIEWLGTSSFTVRDLIAGACDEDSKIAEAMEILFLILRADPRPAREVYAKAKEEGVARKTLERAKKILRVPSSRQKNNWHWWWEWRLPADETEILLQLRQKYEALDNVAPISSQAVAEG